MLMQWLDINLCISILEFKTKAVSELNIYEANLCISILEFKSWNSNSKS